MDEKNDFTESLRKIFLAGVGAVATGAEKSTELLDDFIKKGELTVEQGKALNQELTHKAKEAAADASDAVIRTKLQTMSTEERAEYLAHLAEVSAQIDADKVKDAVEDVVEPDDAE